MSKNKRFNKFEDEKDNSEKINNEEVKNNNEEVIESNDEIIEEIAEENNIEEPIVEKAVRGIVTCEKLNVRKEADKNSEVLTIIPKDLILTITDSDISQDFYKVLIGDIEGYCMKQFIAIIAE